jgi:hypothetical protein
VTNFVEPFLGSAAVLLGRPHAPGIETVNDKDAFLANVWRALQGDPEQVVTWADQPVNEADLHARHLWLVDQRATFTARLMGDPDYYDAKVAGWWLWGICCWIGRAWCSGNGPWQSVDGQLVKGATSGQGISRPRVHLGDAGQGIHRPRVHLGQQGVGMGVHALRARAGGLLAWFEALQSRLRYVRVCCGDWTRVLGPSVTFTHGLTGIVFDPPYSAEEQREAGLYAVDDLHVAHAVRAWCVAHGQHPLLRIVLCGYGTVHDELLAHGWTKQCWSAAGGMANSKRDKSNLNKYEERLWCSPNCLTGNGQLNLFPDSH